MRTVELHRCALLKWPHQNLAAQDKLVHMRMPARQRQKCPGTPVKLSPELGEIIFSSGKPKLTPGEVPTFQGF